MERTMEMYGGNVYGVEVSGYGLDKVKLKEMM